MVSDRKPHRNDLSAPHRKFTPCRRHVRNEPVVQPPDHAHETRTAPWKGDSPRVGGTSEMSRWCNHRTTPTKHEPRPGRAREGNARSGGKHRSGTYEYFSRPCRGASRIGGGWTARFRWFSVAPRPSPPANLFRASGSQRRVFVCLSGGPGMVILRTCRAPGCVRLRFMSRWRRFRKIGRRTFGMVKTNSGRSGPRVLTAAGPGCGRSGRGTRHRWDRPRW
jgi:hypothetical protein